MPQEKITKDKIINSLLICAFEKSVEATSLSDIADKLKIKKASLYNHFKNREDIIEATIRFCSDTILKTSLIPPDVESIAQKYSVETVLKGIVNRWLKLNTKDPLLHIYSFLQGEKYFSSSAAMAVLNLKTNLINQISQAFKALINAKKIKSLDKEQLTAMSQIFISFLNDFLSSKLIIQKSEIRQNLSTNEAEDFSEIDKFVDYFCQLLK